MKKKTNKKLTLEFAIEQRDKWKSIADMWCNNNQDDIAVLMSATSCRASEHTWQEVAETLCSHPVTFVRAMPDEVNDGIVECVTCGGWL